MRQLKQRVALRCDLPSLTLPETAAYIAFRIRTAGGEAARLFTREAVTLIHESAKGIPRVVSVICDNTLLSGFALGRKPVGSDIVTEVIRDFDMSRGATGKAPAESSAAAPGPLLVSASTELAAPPAQVPEPARSERTAGTCFRPLGRGAVFRSSADEGVFMKSVVERG